MDYKELNLTREDLVEMYRMMLLIRHFEETTVAYFKQGHVIGNMHMYVGEEAVATGVCKCLAKEDYIASTHRCDGHLIAKGADINKMMAELMGKEQGNCGGRAGKMHQTAPEVGFLSANGIVGASETLGTGHALYCSMFAPGRVSVAFFGDGGGNQGAFHEAMNLAAVWKLPVIFVCENNHFAISTRVDTSTAMGTFYQRAAGYGVPGAGKGTQAERISKILNIPTISTGNILRAAMREGTSVSLQARAYMDAGQLVPDEVIIGIVTERLEKPDCANGFILDGVPRTIAQAEALEAAGITFDAVVSIEISDLSIMARMAGRRVCGHCGASYHLTAVPPKREGICDHCGGKLVRRKDDAPETVRSRLAVYHRETEPLKEFYAKRGLLRTAENRPTVEENTKEMLRALGIKKE